MPAVLLGEASRWDASYAAVRAHLVVVAPPVRDGFAGLLQGLEPVLVETLVAKLAVEALDVAGGIEASAAKSPLTAASISGSANARTELLNGGKSPRQARPRPRRIATQVVLPRPLERPRPLILEGDSGFSGISACGCHRLSRGFHFQHRAQISLQRCAKQALGQAEGGL